MCVSFKKYQQAPILFKMQRKQIPGLKTRGPLLTRLNFGAQWHQWLWYLPLRMACQDAAATQTWHHLYSTSGGRVALQVESRAEESLDCVPNSLGLCPWQLGLVLITEVPTGHREVAWSGVVPLRSRKWCTAMSPEWPRHSR